MTYKVCQVIFSTNRLEYLIPTLRSQKFLNFYGCEVHKVFFDDYPRTRNDNLIEGLVKLYGYNEIILHKENKGLSPTWTEFWELIKDRDYDYIFHQEDDVEILEPILVTDLIELLKNDPEMSQVQLARQAWYFQETDPQAEPDDIIFKNFRYKKGSVLFSPMASLYPSWVTKVPYRDYYDFNLNEGMIGKTLYDHYGKFSGSVKNFQGQKLINHIGEWFVGKRVLPGEPSYEKFERFDPDTKYHSRNGDLY